MNRYAGSVSVVSGLLSAQQYHDSVWSLPYKVIFFIFYFLCLSQSVSIYFLSYILRGEKTSSNLFLSLSVGWYHQVLFFILRGSVNIQCDPPPRFPVFLQIYYIKWFQILIHIIKMILGLHDEMQNNVIYLRKRLCNT